MAEALQLHPFYRGKIQMFSNIRIWFYPYLIGVLGISAAILLGGSFPVNAQKPLVYVVPVEGVIDLGLAPFIERVLEEAAEAKGTAVD